MPTQTYALTYPQLMNQARVARWSIQDLSRLRSAYAIAQKQFDGYYRAQEVPFICHLVRTASIALAENLPPAAVIAGLLHASYMEHVFNSGTMPGRKGRFNAHMREVIGQDVEQVILAYDALPWYSAEAIQRHEDQAAALATESSLRQVLVLRLANELEDHLDLGMAYRGAHPFEKNIRCLGQHEIALAKKLGCGRLAEALEEAFQQHLAESLPGEIKQKHCHAYTTRNRWSVVRLARKTAQVVGKRLRSRKQAAGAAARKPK